MSVIWPEHVERIQKLFIRIAQTWPRQTQRAGFRSFRAETGEIAITLNHHLSVFQVVPGQFRPEVHNHPGFAPSVRR